MKVISRAWVVTLSLGCMVGSQASCTRSGGESSASLAAAESACPTGAFGILTPLALDRAEATPGQTVTGTVTYTNSTAAPVSIRAVVIAGRAPGATHAGGPYQDFAPTQGATTVAPGASVTMTASRAFGASDPFGSWEAYATYEDAMGVWHDDPHSVFLDYHATTAGTFAVSSALELSNTNPRPGETVTARVTYTNATASAVSVKDIVIAGRPPGGSHGGGPYSDFAPTKGAATIAAGASMTLEASRTFQTSDPRGAWDVYATYEDAQGVWHDDARDVSMLFVGGPDGGGGPTPPPAAVAAGYTKLSFDEEFTSAAGIDVNDTGAPGFNFYRRLPFGYPTLPASNFSVADSVLTISSQTGPNMGLVSICGDGAGGWHGFAPTGGAYFEFSVSFDPNAGGAGWPSVWSMAAEHLYGNASEFIEVDFFEYDTKPYDGNVFGFGGAIHQWVNGGIAYTNNNFVVNVPHTTDWKNTFNTIGTLWVPGSGIDVYFNDAVTTDRNSYADNPLFKVADGQHWPVIIGSDGWTMRVDWVRVWTK